jgi:hypothetical protein
MSLAKKISQNVAQLIFDKIAFSEGNCNFAISEIFQKLLKENMSTV